MARMVAVFGATGAQGGSVVRELLKDKQWHVRAVTRNIASSKAKALESEGAEVVYADLDKPETLASAVEGAEVVFGVTDYWQFIEQHGNLEAGKIEARQGISLVDTLAKSSSLKHYIWSTLPRATPDSPGKVEVPHFNAKHDVDLHLKANHPKLAAKTTFLNVGWYIENMAWYPFFSPHKYGNTDQYVLIHPCSPETKIPMAGNVRKNVGAAVKAILAHPESSLPAKLVPLSLGLMTYPEVLEKWTKATGKQVTYIHCTAEEFQGLYPATGLELSLQYEFLENVATAQVVNPDLVRLSDIGIKENDLGGVGETLQELAFTWD